MEILYIVEGSCKREAVEVKCDYCKKIFLKQKRFINTKKQGRIKNYCCVEHRGLAKQNRIELKCSHCEKTFYRAKSKLLNSKHGLYFCNRVCKEKAQSLNGGNKKLQPLHYGNGEFNYRTIAFKEYDNKCEICGYDEHIEILEVHHIDKNRKNNIIKNLIILCPNHHKMLHRKVAILEKRKLVIVYKRTLQ